MATVRITNFIRTYVRDQLGKMYLAQVKKVERRLQTLDIGNVCVAHYIPSEYRKLAQQLNADPAGPWIDLVKQVIIRISYSDDATPNTEKAVRFTVPLNPPALLPARIRVCGASFQLLETMPLYADVKKIFLEIDRINAEYDKVVDQLVDGILTKCATLQQVLELWPTALDFMPDDVKQKHAAKAEKRRPRNRRPAVKELAISDDVKISIMKVRMLTAGG